jgi:hypothetical protein
VNGNRNGYDETRKKRDRMRFHNWTVLLSGLGAQSNPGACRFFCTADSKDSILGPTATQRLASKHQLCLSLLVIR